MVLAFIILFFKHLKFQCFRLFLKNKGQCRPWEVGTVHTKLHLSKLWAPLPLDGGSWGIGGVLGDWQPWWRVRTPPPDEPTAALSCLQQLHGEGWVGGGGQHPRGKFGTGIKKKSFYFGKSEVRKSQKCEQRSSPRLCQVAEPGCPCLDLPG